MDQSYPNAAATATATAVAGDAAAVPDAAAAVVPRGAAAVVPRGAAAAVPGGPAAALPSGAAAALPGGAAAALPGGAAAALPGGAAAALPGGAAAAVPGGGAVAQSAPVISIPEFIPAKKWKDGSITFDVTIRHIIEQTLLHALNRPEFRKTKLVFTSDDDESDIEVDDSSPPPSSAVATEAEIETDHEQPFGDTPEPLSYRSSSDAAAEDPGQSCSADAVDAAAGTDSDATATGAADVFVATATAASSAHSEMATAIASPTHSISSQISGMPIKLRMKRTYSTAPLTNNSQDEQACSPASSRPDSCATLSAAASPFPSSCHSESPRSIDTVIGASSGSGAGGGVSGYSRGGSYVGSPMPLLHGIQPEPHPQPAHVGGLPPKDRNASLSVPARSPYANEYQAIDLSVRSQQMLQAPPPAHVRSQVPQASGSSPAIVMPSFGWTPSRSFDIAHFNAAGSALEQLAAVATGAIGYHPSAVDTMHWNDEQQ